MKRESLIEFKVDVMKHSYIWMTFLFMNLGCATTENKESSLYECQKVCAAVTESWCQKEIKKNRGCSPAKRAKEHQFCMANQCPQY